MENNEIHDADFNDFKDAILNGTLSDEFNLTENEIGRLTATQIDSIIRNLLNSVFSENGILVPLDDISSDSRDRLEFYMYFQQLYTVYLSRNLEIGEQNVFNTAIKIIFWKIHGKTFKNICWYRYSFASKSRERESLERLGRSTDHIDASFFIEYHDLPDKSINVYSYFGRGFKAKDVDYDFIMFYTYDYIDKLIGFKLSDVFYTAFYKYYQRTNDARSIKLAKLIKYGTDNERHIWMLRYGLSFEDIEFFDEHISEINAQEIIFKESIYQ